MATMKDIARAVGVSLTTVSNVVHGNYDRVSPQTVARILEAIEQMHYVPNMSARALVSHSSRIIAFLETHSPQETYAGNGFAGVLLSGLESVVTDHGYFLMMRRGTDEATLRLMLNNWNPDGVIFKDCVPQSLVSFVQKQGKPCVAINTYLDDPQLIQVRASDHEGGRIATEHLLSLGHRDILFVGAVHHGFSNNDQRYLGHCDALRAAGIEPRPGNLINSLHPFGAERGIALGHQLAKQKHFTAICVSGDQYAVAIMAGLREGGVRVPEDISIIGFDDVDIARMCYPPLTTIRQDGIGKGKRAAEAIFSLIAGESPDPADFTLPVELIVRGTTAPVRTTG
ncbi:MAG: LacI family DNA-binding transcriptional regulator [Clostridia bacterium]|nr:LacI family DNA-binding transcriptional regulator [Clostridia bacterium]